MSGARRALAGGGALACAAALALAAIGSHALAGDAVRRAGLAAAVLFGHGLALLVLAPAASSRRMVALCALALGALLFAGSLAGAALAGWSTAAAPVGGLLLIAGWLALAVDAGLR